MSENSINNKHYDVGIYGLWYGRNYGSISTYFALNSVIQKLGYTTAMIDNPLNMDGVVLETLPKSHPRRFAAGKYNILPHYSLNEMDKLNRYCNAFLLGSDQLWNYGLSRPYKQTYFLDFVEEAKLKIAYGTSFGKAPYNGPQNELEKIKKNLERFTGVSVRDDFSKEILNNELHLEATQVMDPVFLCPKENYEQLIEAAEPLPENDYIFAYILDPNPEIGKSLLNIIEQTGKKMLIVFDEPANDDERMARLEIQHPNLTVVRSPAVNTWLSCYKNADFVITDSFHGACFSIIFERNFIVLKNNGRGGARFECLLNTVGLIERMATSPQQMLEKYNELAQNSPIDYKAVEERLSVERKRGYDWLADKLKTICNNVMTTVVPQNICSGCGACEALCPKGAIKMVKNKDGFLVPEVDQEKCINCGICLKKCTSLNPVYKNNSNPVCNAVMASDEIRKISSSGGMFTVAAEYVIEQGGYVCGAAYKEDFSVEHVIVNDKDDLGQLRGSKYMQSYASGIFPKIKDLLKGDNLVLFTGMPCQVAALYSYLGQEYDNLYTMDLLCHGITSSKVFEKYHNDVLEGKELSRLEFKEKEPWGWHAGVNAYFTDGTKYSKPLEHDLFFTAYLKSIAKNITCGSCVSNSLPRQGDLTIGDFWGIAKYDEEVYDKKGTSVVLVNNQHAEMFFERLKSRMMKFKEEPLSVAVGGNRIIKAPYRLHKNRNEFFEHFDELDFSSLTRGCYHNDLYKYEKLELLKKLPEELHAYYYIAKTTAENCNGRKIVTWIQSLKFEKILKDFFGMEVAFSIAKAESRVNNETIFPLSRIQYSSEEFYIVALDSTNPDETYKIFDDYGYKEIKDFICRFPKPIVLKDYDCAAGRYSDAYGNTIDGYTGKLGKVVFRGCNNHIIISDKVTGIQNLTFDLGTDTYIEIEKECRFHAENKFISRGHSGKSKVVIRSGCRFTDALYRLFESGQILINEECTFETHLELHANAGKKIVIGRDCMFSHDIDLWAGDGHTIFDVVTGENINSAYKKQAPHKNAIIIGEHVWVGKGAFIMHGTNIGNGSIVGAKSVVKGEFLNNCSIGGNPAKLIRRDCAWARDIVTENLERCGRKEYCALTAAAKPSISGAKVLVIGGTRFMGVQLVKQLISLGNEITIATRGRKKDSFGIDVERVVMDISNKESVAKALNGKRFDVVFDNLAYCSNYVDNVLSAVKCSRYIQLSSVESYKEKKIDLRETDFNPRKNPMKWVDVTAGYVVGKRQAETALYQKYKGIDGVTVRIPYVTKTERLYYYCSHIVNQIPMSIDDRARGFTFIRDTEVGSFLPWIANQTFRGPINLASEGMVTIDEIIKYIEKKTKQKAIIDVENGDKSPFHEYNETTFSMNMDLAKGIGYKTSNIHEWFWDLLDKYIERALREKNK